MRKSDGAAPIVEATRWDRETFERGHLFPRTPLCIRSTAPDRDQLTAWHPRHLANQVGHREVLLPDDSAIDFSEYVEALLRLEGEPLHGERGTPGIPYLTHVPACETFPELQAEEWIPPLARPNWLERWELRGLVPALWLRWVELLIGAAGMGYPSVHFDAYITHAWVRQMHSRKRFSLWPPFAGQPDHLSHAFRENVLAADSPDTKTLMGHSQPSEIVLNAGDVLFIPAGWWHLTEIFTTSVTLSGNFVNDSNWGDFARAWGPTRGRRQRLWFAAARAVLWARNRATSAIRVLSNPASR